MINVIPTGWNQSQINVIPTGGAKHRNGEDY